MSLSVVYSRARLGIQAPLVSIEAHLSNGLPSLAIVGMPETAVKESKDRVRSAILNSQFEFPARRITINLAPADLPKTGGQFDLAIALGILAASGQIPKQHLSRHEFIGELALSGEVRAINGCLPAAIACHRSGRQLVCPQANAGEAMLSLNKGSDCQVFSASSLLSVCQHLHGQQSLPQLIAPEAPVSSPRATAGDLSDVKGQHQAKRALEIAAAGRHHLLFFGPPGTGKSMLASRLPGLLPPLTPAQQLEVACIQSVSGGLNIATSGNPATAPNAAIQRPFSAPHHTASAVALVGGGSQPKPGEISLAHQGVLFLDELPEFQRQVLEVLREPLECGSIRISRALAQVEFPAAFQLIAAMNPCPCGYWGQTRCRCSREQVQRYQNKISGPLLDRIDLHVPVAQLKKGELYGEGKEECSAQVQARVSAAQTRQQQRQGCCNGELNSRQLQAICPLPQSQQRLLDQAMEVMGLSARALHRTLKVARTIADLEATATIADQHLTEALSYRGFCPI